MQCAWRSIWENKSHETRISKDDLRDTVGVDEADESELRSLKLVIRSRCVRTLTRKTPATKNLENIQFS